MLGATIRKVVNAKENGPIEVWGTGKARRDFLHIDDLCDFVYAALSNQKNNFDLFNCGCGYSTSINELVQKIIDVSGKKLEICNNLEKPDIPTALSIAARLGIYLDGILEKNYRMACWKHIIGLNNKYRRK